MHVLDYILDRISGLFRFNNYPLVEKAYSVMFYVVGLSLRDLSKRYYVTMASKESVRKWFHKFSKMFSVEKGFRDSVVVDETVVKMHGICMLSCIRGFRGKYWRSTPHGDCYEVP
jgi:transposase-like protein